MGVNSMCFMKKKKKRKKQKEKREEKVAFITISLKDHSSFVCRVRRYYDGVRN